MVIDKLLDPKRSKLGSELTAREQRYVLSAFVHRYTRDHTPDWARYLRPNGTRYPVQFASDQEWLAHTRFVIRKNGALSLREGQCYSTPTWPDGKGLEDEAA